ncbi:response regulator [Spirosoma aureum]|uniref:histidine kinase n=1 Tax=Spirosoma aureum TaxID=2692134 RepID=A0A6G9AU34_9BACT|nr:two-component regulator propeller domain-containing protein [Spirosoma aureum]QIP15836.1 response regulator [Spirosoma aureum]
MKVSVCYCHVYLLLALSVLAGQTCIAQNLAFNHLSVDNGLSQNSVLSIVQDRRGLMWFGTRNGLNRYDSRTFKVYKNDPVASASVSDDYILSLCVDSDNTLWVGTVKGLSKYKSETDSFEQVLSGPEKKSDMSSRAITCIFQDSHKNIWVGTDHGLNLLTDRSTNTFRTFFQSATGLAGNNVRTIFEDHEGSLWVGTSTGLTRIQREKSTFQFVSFRHNATQSTSLSDDYVTAITEDGHHKLWVGTKYGGLNAYNRATRTFSAFTHNKSVNSLINNNIRKLLVDQSNRIWIGTLEGLSIYDDTSQKFTTYQHDPENRKSLSQNSIYEIMQDANGSIWVGTYYGGVNVVYSQETPFVLYQNRRQPFSISNDLISAIAADSKDNLWVGTEGGGLNYFDRKAGRFTRYQNENTGVSGLRSNLVKAVSADVDGRVWIGTHLGGLNVLDPTTNRIRQYLSNPDNPVSLSSDDISALADDGQGHLWVGTDRSGLNYFDKKSGKVEQYTTNTSPIKLTSDFIRILFVDSRRRLWVGTAHGITVISSERRSIKQIINNRVTKGSLRTNQINCIQEDSKGQIWVGNYFGGLSRYDVHLKDLATYTEKDGLPSDNILGILEDKQGFLWLSTDNGLSRFDPDTKRFTNYNINDGLPGNEFSLNSFYRDSGGELFFGSNNGLVRFRPDKFKTNSYDPTIILTSLKLFNQPVGINDPTGLLEKDISHAPRLMFKHDQSIFTLDFALLNYIKASKNTYAYKLDGFEENWNFVKTPSATYTNLPAGTYTFLVRGANNDGIWSKVHARIEIEVMPPFWRTWWAYLTYVMLVASFLYFMIRFFWMRESLRRDHELQQLKLNFFTNISHEIRTHLTLIGGPIENLLTTASQDSNSFTQLTHVKNNSDRLSKLVNELMDFRKAETNNLMLQVTKVNLIALLDEIRFYFQDLATARNMKIDFLYSNNTVAVYVDRAQLEKVFFNLLTNAFKFTPDGGFVSILVQEQKDTVVIKVVDNGKGIAPENLKKIFTNFFQVNDTGAQNTGYGIGLALSKSLIEAHKGTIAVESNLQNGRENRRTCFTVTLKRGADHFATNQLVTDMASTPVLAPVLEQFSLGEEEKPIDSIPKPTLLLVEDNAEVRAFIRESLIRQYVVTEAINGEEGWALAIEHIPDLIISDVMMAEMDGLALCRKLKTDERTSHIPIVLLTARATFSQQVEGLETRADSYMTKPFSLRMLKLNVRNLLSSRDAMRQKYSRQISLQPQNIVINSLDEQFLSKIVRITENHLDDPAFGVSQLATQIGMSAPVLYKKLRALTDMSVNDFVKSIRLKKAAQLLKQKQLTVYEVAYSVGYDDRKYFSKEFKKQFGKTPSDYASEPVSKKQLINTKTDPSDY